MLTPHVFNRRGLRRRPQQPLLCNIISWCSRNGGRSAVGFSLDFAPLEATATGAGKEGKLGPRSKDAPAEDASKAGERWRKGDIDIWSDERCGGKVEDTALPGRRIAEIAITGHGTQVAGREQPDSEEQDEQPGGGQVGTYTGWRVSRP